MWRRFPTGASQIFRTADADAASIGTVSVLCLREPPHVHVEHEDKVAKFWLNPVRLQRGGGMSRLDLRRIERLVMMHRDMLWKKWSDYFHV